MLDRTKYFTKTILIFFSIFIISIILGFYFDNFNLFSWFIMLGFVLFFYRQYKFLKINYNYNNKKNFIIFLSLSILLIISHYIYLKDINKPINFISNMILYIALPTSSLIFNTIESKIKKTDN